MIVRRYEAATEEEALQKVHVDLGPRAVILLTKQEPGENCEVVAAINPMDIGPDSDNTPGPPPREAPPAVYPRPDAQAAARPSPLPNLAAASSAPLPAPRVMPPQADPPRTRDPVGAPDVRGDSASQGKPGPALDSSWLTKIRRGLARDAYGGDQDRGASVPTPSPISIDAVLRQRLEQHDVEEDLLEAILTTARSHVGADDIQTALIGAILSRVKFSGGIATTGSPSIVALLGPTGVGKTTTTAKLAAHHRLQKQKRVGLITMDTTRVGGSEQLQAYANIIDVPCVVAQTPHDVTEAIASYAAYDLVLIDTPGRAASDGAGLADLKALLDAARPHETHLLVSATTRRIDLWETARGFQPLSPGHIAFTKLDETTAFGDILNFAHHTQLPLSYFSTGQTVPDAIEVAAADRLARLLVSERRPFYC
jgi:flagellar biosynthesis protein FlhF